MLRYYHNHHPPTLTLEIEALPSDEDDDNEPNVCSDTTYVQFQLHENRWPQKRGLSTMKTSSSAARDESPTKKYQGTVI